MFHTHGVTHTHTRTHTLYMNEDFNNPSSHFDAAVQGTHIDAAVAKTTCAAFGYIHDPWVHHFAHSPNQPNPLFNRGYWARVRGVQLEVANFMQRAKELAPDKSVQIVNLGSGLDTMYWWLKHEKIEGRLAEMNVTYFEMDFPEIIQKKTRIVQRNNLLPDASVAVNAIHGTQEIRTPDCRYVAGDLRMIQEVKASLEAAGFDSTQHTCFVCECVLIYMQSLSGNSIIEWTAQAVTSPDVLNSLVLYEQTNAHTAFGKMMIKNLNQRGCPLLSIHDFPDMKSQEKRYLDRGWKYTVVQDMNSIYNGLPEEERNRIHRIELLDELEELWLIQSHYLLLVASSHPFKTAIVPAAPNIPESLHRD